jgi:hypothetical protein
MNDQPMRYRFPALHRNMTALVVLLAGIAGVIAVIAVGAAVSLWFRLDGQVSRIDKLSRENSRLALQSRAAQRATFASRRAATVESCAQREQLKSDLRKVLEGFKVPLSALPPSSDGRPVLSPLVGGCKAYVSRTVPEESRP